MCALMPVVAAEGAPGGFLALPAAACGGWGHESQQLFPFAVVRNGAFTYCVAVGLSVMRTGRPIGREQ